jgi:glycosyltransferase involved in cell wall biosynthesis
MEEKLGSELPPGAEMLGYLPRRDLYERMARAHCLLMTSVREGWGMVITEANSVGTPAVGYDVPGVRDAIRNGETGLLTGGSTPDQLATAALALMEDARAYDDRCEQALEGARCFSWQRTAAALIAIAMPPSVLANRDAIENLEAFGPDPLRERTPSRSQT